MVDGATLKVTALGLAAILAVVAVVAGACAPLKLYNTLVPADSAGQLAASDIAYGEHSRHKLDVYVPEGKPAAAPVVVVFYGGSWNSGSKADYGFLGKALASKGFVAVIADYRLVPEVRFPDFIEDSARATVWTHRRIKEFGGDPNRLFLFGHSAGAYNAVMVALDNRFLQAQGSSTSIIRGVAALAGPYDFLPLDVTSTQEAFGRASDLASTQPINFVTTAAPAMFLATGTADTTVLPRNTAALAERLKRAGRPVRTRSYPGISHIGILLALSVPFRSTAPVLDDVAAFIAGQ